MSFEEHSDAFIWRCDTCRQEVIFPPSNFWACVDELKGRGWQFTRLDDWVHRCRKCRKSDTNLEHAAD
jgi:predicted RNA-binding Zn-ribbon protein involved in translation (DUF1610 family)